MDVAKLKKNAESRMKAEMMKNSVRNIIRQERDRREGLISLTKDIYEPILTTPIRKAIDDSDEKRDESKTN